MYKRRWFQNSLLLIGLFVSTLLVSMLSGAAAVTHAQIDGPTLVVLPNEIAPGGEIRLTGYNFIPGDVLDIGLVGGPESILLGQVQTDENGNIPLTTLLLPDTTESDAYFIQAQGLLNDIPVQTELFVRPAPAIRLDPAGGPPGTVVNITVSDLAPGSLRLDYAGVAVLGPLAIGGNSYSGSFIVPNDRPGPLGAATTVRAVNLVNGLIVGQAEANFQSEGGPGQPTYQVTNLQLPQGPLENGSSFTIKGQISPPPNGPLDQYQVIPMWRSNNGKNFPISDGAGQIKADGTFMAPAYIPSLFQGDPASAQTADQVGIALIAPTTIPSPTYHQGPLPPEGVPLYIQVIAEDTGQVIEDAKIRVVRTDQAIGTINHASSLLTGNLNQVAGSLDNEDDYELTPQEKQQVLIARSGCPLIITEKPDPKPGNPLIDPTLEEFFEVPIFQNLLNQNAQPLSNVNVLASALATENTKTQATDTISYRVFIDAIAQGYGEVGSDSKAKIGWVDVVYHKNSKSYTTPNGLPLTNPLQVTLKKLPDYAISPLGDIFPIFEGLADVEKHGATFGNYYSLKNIPTDVQSPATTSSEVSVVLSLKQYHSLAKNGLKLYIDDAYKGTFNFVFKPEIKCNTKTGQSSLVSSAYVGTFDLHNPHLLRPDKLPLPVRLEATLTTNDTYDYYYFLQVNELPGWISDPAYKNRTAQWSPQKVTLSGERFNASDDVPLGENLNPDFFGQVNNVAGLDLKYTQTLFADGSSQPKQSGGTRTVVWNETMPECTTVPNQPDKCEPSKAASAITVNELANIPIDKSFNLPRVENDQGKLVFGIPKVADVTIGVKTFYKAAVSMKGNISLNDQKQGPQLDLTVTPSANAGADGYGDLTILADIAADAQIHFIPNIGVMMPVHFTNGGIDDTKICFPYRLDYTWHASVGCVPEVCLLGECTGGWCAWEGSGVKPIIKPGFVPKDSSFCKAPPEPQSLVASASTVSTPAPHAKPSLATDGLGHTMAVWQAANDQIVVSTFDGLNWTTPISLTEQVAADAPSLAFFAPNQALVVWTQNALTIKPTTPLSLDEAIQQQFLVYTIWNGVSWSPPQPLTTPSTGEGGVVLAGCPSNTAGCPAGGAVTAVWVRNVGTEFAQHQFRLYAATFQNGTWSSPQPVDAASNAADGQPMIVYRNGVPLAGWVRDADRSFTTANDRRLALRPLDGSSPVTILNDLPDSIVSGSLAARKNGELVLAFTVAGEGALLGPHSDLHLATQLCSGVTCSWQTHKLVDPYGRSLRAERPVVVLDEQDGVIVTFRGLGFGPDPNGEQKLYPNDPPGMVKLTGELAQIKFNGSPQVNLHYLSANGAVNWQPAAIFEPLTNNSLALAVQGPLSVGLSQAKVEATVAPASNIAANQPIVFAAVPQLPDFALTSVEPPTNFQPDQPFDLNLTIQNNGTIWEDNAENPLEVVATWNGGPGVGTPAGLTGITSLGPSQTVQVTLQITPPPETLDREHTLAVTVNPNQIITEQSAENNSQSLTLGGLPIPEGLTVATGPGTPLVFLEWQPLDDSRVAGYRTYRIDDESKPIPVGSSFVNGWVDLKAEHNQTYRYAVTSFTAEGIESELGDLVEVTVPSLPDDPGPNPVLYLPAIFKAK